MKKLIIPLLTILIAFTAQAKKHTAILSSTFHGVSGTTGHIFDIKQNNNGQWNIEEFLGCDDYPCDISTKTIIKKYYPTLASSPTQQDGNTEITLGADYKVIFVNKGMSPPNANGMREESFWKLVILLNESILEEIKLDFEPTLIYR